MHKSKCCLSIARFRKLDDEHRDDRHRQFDGRHRNRHCHRQRQYVVESDNRKLGIVDVVVVAVVVDCSGLFYR